MEASCPPSTPTTSLHSCPRAQSGGKLLFVTPSALANIAFRVPRRGTFHAYEAQVLLMTPGLLLLQAQWITTRNLE